MDGWIMEGPKNVGDQGKKLSVVFLKPGDKLFEEVRGNTGGQLFKAGEVISEQDIATMKPTLQSRRDYL
jgi:hypothetical protein